MYRERPRFIGTAPVAGTGLFLMCVSARVEPDLTLIASAAEAISALDSAGPLTAEDIHSSQGLESLVNNLNVPLIFVDSSTFEVFLNDPARQLLNLPKKGLSNRRVAAKLARLVADDYPESSGFSLASSPFANLDFEIERGGRSYNVESRWVDDGVLLGRIWMFRDVTREYEAARMKDQLVATVSHELRTPLTAIIGSLGLIQAGVAGQVAEQAAKLVEMAHRNANRLVKIVNDLLDIEKMQSGKMDYSFMPVDLCALIEEVARQNAPYAETFGVSIGIEQCREPLIVLGDESRMAQVLANLVSNAAKFSPRDAQILLRLERLDSAARISVIDKGRGISEEFRKHLFTPFAQEAGSAVPGQASSGLGLAICKSIVEAHGGEISLGATSPEGSTFRIDLPLNKG